MSVCNSQFVFVHIPKTGGNWVERALANGGVSFERAGWHPKPEQLEIGDRFCFAFIREPFSWYRSLWSFHRILPQDGWLGIGEWIDRDLPSFIEAVAACPGYLTGFFAHQTASCDFVGRNENIAEDLVEALTLAGVDFDEKALRATPKANNSGPYPDCPESVRELVRESEASVYERFYP